MAVITQGLYQVTLEQQIGQNQIRNVYWYRNQSGDNDKSQEMWDAFNGNVMNQHANAQHENVVYTNLQVISIFGSQLEINGQPTITQGAVTGTLLPAFTVASIRLLRSNRDLRSGWKRISGITEENVESPGFTAAYMVLLQALANEVTVNLSGGVEVFTPSIVRKPFTTKAQSPDWEAIDTNTGLALDRVTSQNTRKTF